MPNDPNGVKMLYPTKSGGKIFHSGTTMHQSNQVHFDDDITHLGSGVYKMATSDYEQLRQTILPDSSYDLDGYNSIGEDNMNFSQTATRGYAAKSTDWKNVEHTYFVKMTHFDPDDNPVTLKGPTDKHSADPDCSAACYGARVFVNDNPIKVSFFKEIWHVHYETRNEKTLTYGTWCDNAWHGMKYVRYNIENNTKVKLEHWLNDNGDGQTWVKVNETVDAGGWNDQGDVCNGNDSQILTWGGPRMMFRTDARDGTDLQFKWVGVRQIDPTASFTETPSGGTGTPGTGSGGDTTVLEISFPLNYDVNIYRSSQCAPGGSAIFYASNSLDGNEWRLGAGADSNGDVFTRAGFNADTASSFLVNRGSPLLEADFYLRKSGSPTGTLTVRVRNINDSIKATMGTLDVSTLTGSFAEKLFINLGNTYRLVTGDKILAEYSGGDSSNYVLISKRDTLSGALSGNTPNTNCVRYRSSGAAPLGYLEYNSREINGSLWD